MLLHDRFVFLQMRKTGCTYLAETLRRELGASVASYSHKHSGWNGIPAEAASRPALTYIRNPWDWYVSWYHFNLNMPEPTEFWRQLSEDGALDFAATIRNAVAVSTPEWGADFYSAIFRHLVGNRLDSELLTIGRFESLADDLERFLVATGVELSDGAVARIRAGTPVNSSDRGPYREYYNDELRDLVGASCGWLIDRFGYRF